MNIDKNMHLWILIGISFCSFIESVDSDNSLNTDISFERPVIRIGFCKGRQSSMAFDLLSSLGIRVFKEQRSSSKNFLIKADLNENINLVESKAKDIATLLEKKIIDVAICYDNVIPQSIDSACIKLGLSNGFHPVQVVVVKRRGGEIPENPIIFSEYPELSLGWSNEIYPHADTISVTGGAETFLADKMCDLAVVVKDKGDTIIAHNLEVFAVLSVADLCVYILPNAQEEHPEFIDFLKNTLVTI